jgi:hypothetical protein
MPWRRESPPKGDRHGSENLRSRAQERGLRGDDQHHAGAKVNPEHSHPFDVKAMVLKGALTLNRDGGSQTYKPGEVFAMPRGCVHYESYGDEGAVVLLGRKH